MPQNDDTAIRELERLRKEGAAFIVFAEPALWWFHYYFGLRDYLHLNFRCVFENEHLLVFDLRPRFKGLPELTKPTVLSLIMGWLAPFNELEIPLGMDQAEWLSAALSAFSL